MENTRKIENTGHMHCLLLLSSFVSDKSKTIPDCPVKYWTLGNPTRSID